MVPRTVKARVVFKCPGCGEASPRKEDLKHKPEEHKEEVATTCAASGKFPHVAQK